MSLNILDRVPTENFVIENNIIKGVQQEFPESYQIGKLLFEAFDSKPDHVSQIQAETEQQTTFAEMKENSVRCALWLKKQGIGSGDVITICCRDHLNAYIPVFATFFVGATYNGWNSAISLREAQHLIRTIQPNIIFVSEETVKIVTEASKIENFSGKIIGYDNLPGLPSLKLLMQQQTNDEIRSFQPRILTNPEDIAYIILSSGSTGLPKGVTHSYGNFVKQIATQIPHAIKGLVLTYTYWFGLLGFMYCMQSIFTRATRILHRHFDPEETCKVIEKYKVENFLALPTFLNAYTKLDLFKKYQLKSLQILNVGGCMVSERVLNNFRKIVPHTSVYHGMGASEMGRTILSQTNKYKAIGSVGFVMSCTEIKICDLETKEALDPNMLGELCAKSSTRTKGYYNNKGATKAAFDDEGWYHTGDVAYYNEDGEFFIVDRIKEVMRYQIYQVSPNEIEDVLLSHPDVMEAVVVPIPHEIDDNHPMAFVKKSPGSKVAEEELVKLSECLGQQKKLHGGVKFIDEIPKLGSGKVDRQKLKEWAKTRATMQHQQSN